MTSAGIGMKMPDGSIKAFRLNCDGYPGHAGAILAGWYKTEDRKRCWSWANWPLWASVLTATIPAKGT